MLNELIVLRSRIEEIVTNFGTHLNVELQQRGIEYAQLFTKHIALRPAIMERIPPMEHKPSHQDTGLTNGSSGGFVSNGDDDMLMDDLNSFTTTSHSAPPTKDSVTFKTLLNF